MTDAISHYGISALITAYGMTILSAAVSSLPIPCDDSSPYYKWFYKFSNTVMANVSALRGKAQYEENKPAPPKE